MDKCNHESTYADQPMAFSQRYAVMCGACGSQLTEAVYNTVEEAERAETAYHIGRGAVNEASPPKFEKGQRVGWTNSSEADGRIYGNTYGNVQHYQGSGKWRVKTDEGLTEVVEQSRMFETAYPVKTCESEVDARVACGLEMGHAGDCDQLGVMWNDAKDIVEADAPGSCDKLVRVKGTCEKKWGHDGAECYTGRLKAMPEPDNEYTFATPKPKYKITQQPSGNFRVNGGPVTMDDYWVFGTKLEALQWVERNGGQLIEDTPTEQATENVETMRVTILFERKGGKLEPVTARAYDDVHTDEDVDVTVFDLAIENPVTLTLDVPIDDLYSLESSVPNLDTTWCPDGCDD